MIERHSGSVVVGRSDLPDRPVRLSLLYFNPATQRNEDLTAFLCVKAAREVVSNIEECLKDRKEDHDGD